MLRISSGLYRKRKYDSLHYRNQNQHMKIRRCYCNYIIKLHNKKLTQHAKFNLYCVIIRNQRLKGKEKQKNRKSKKWSNQKNSTLSCKCCPGRTDLRQKTWKPDHGLCWRLRFNRNTRATVMPTIPAKTKSPDHSRASMLSLSDASSTSTTFGTLSLN